MKRTRLDRWGAKWLSSRSRGNCPYRLQAHNHRPQSTQASQFSSSPAILTLTDDPTTLSRPSSIPSETKEKKPRLDELPSPPVSRSVQSAKLNALHARLSLPSRLPIQTLARTLVDRTADPDPRFNNSSLALLGSSILGYYTSEHLICHYPRLPMDVLFAAMAAYVGPRALAAITKEWGVEFVAEPGGEVDPGLLQFRRTPPGIDPHGEGEPASMKSTGRNDRAATWRRGISSRVVYDDEFGNLRRTARAPSLGGRRVAKPVTTADAASAQFVRALVGALHVHAGRHSARQFQQLHVLARTLNLSAIFDFKFPTRDLSRLCLREGFEPPVARLISETGRLSRHPVFVVGVYSGRDKLGEGAGASLDEARVRAATAALKGWYLYSPMDVVTPSEVEDGDADGRWKPNMVDCGEIIT